MDERIKKLIRPEIRALSAYHVPPPGDLIKLDAMENPYTWPDELKQQWTALLSKVELNRYPDPSADRLKHVLREAMLIPSGMDIMLGNGSDELIQIIAMAVSGNAPVKESDVEDSGNKKKRCIMAPEPSFVMYKMIAAYTDMDYVGVPLNQDFGLDCQSMLAAIEQHQPAVLFLAYPNNPTGNLFNEDDIDNIIEACDGIVVIDEAYHAFADSTYMDKLSRYHNLFVMRTVSKMGLAGLRLGLLAGHPEWLDEFEKVRLPYNINSLTQMSVEFAMQHQDVLNAQTEQICIDRGALLQQLDEIIGITPFPSKANFILFRVPVGRADEIFDALKEGGVLIKKLHGSSEPLQDCLRVTVGSPDENAAFIAGLTKCLS